MAKYITIAQLEQLYQAQLIENDEYLRLLKEFAGLVAAWTPIFLTCWTRLAWR